MIRALILAVLALVATVAQAYTAGYSYRGHCYADKGTALAAMCAGDYPWSMGGSSIISCAGSAVGTGGAGTITQVNATGSGSTTTTLVVNPPTCNLDSQPMDWTNSTHLMQALLVACCALAMFMGYRAGDKI